ncbi:MAG: hypothetical protein ACK4F8_10860 [Aquabacterium sp.]
MALWTFPAPACAQTAYYSHPFVMGIGLHSGQGRAPFSKGEPVLRYAGTSSTRQEATWSRIELTKGELAYPPNLKDVEAYVDNAVEKGGYPLIILNYGNKFYDGGDGVYSDEGIAGFVRYATFLANYFKGRVKFYEVWNEWDLGLGSNKNPRTIRDVATYVRLLKATYKAVKKTDPSATILGGAATTSRTHWTDEFIDEGGLDHLDGFSTHPYMMWNIKSKPEHSIKLLDDLHSKIQKARPERNIPIYVTEIGWPTHQGHLAWTPDHVADFIVRFHLLARARPFIGGVWWYSLANDAREQDNKEKAFGLVDYDYKPKPALEAYRTAHDLISRLSSIDVVADDIKSNQASLRLKLKNGKRCRAHWQISTHDHEKGLKPGGASRDKRAESSEKPDILCK